jgi:hypothetical protein
MASLEGVRHVEWEYLSTPIEVGNLSPSPELVPHPKIARLSRRDDYEFELKFEGDNANFGLAMPGAKARPGELYSGVDITGNSGNMGSVVIDKITLRGVHTGSRRIKGDGKFTIEGGLHRIENQRITAEVPHRVIEYCASGATTSPLYLDKI